MSNDGKSRFGIALIIISAVLLIITLSLRTGRKESVTTDTSTESGISIDTVAAVRHESEQTLRDQSFYEGYEDGYADGEEDALEGTRNAYSYNFDSPYYEADPERYREGYEEGYDEAYENVRLRLEQEEKEDDDDDYEYQYYNEYDF